MSGDFFKTIERLCLTDAPSGSEYNINNIIMEQIAPYCDAKTDVNGNIIAFKKGKNRAAKKVMLDAHTDEVGFIVTDITDDGFLRFETLGGINTSALICKRVKINGITGVIGTVPIHLCTAEERKQMPSTSSLLIDIGAQNKEVAQKHVSPGDSGTFEAVYNTLEKNKVNTKALDDRIGCAILIELLKKSSEYDFYATFTVGEELGCRGAKTAAYTVDPDYSIVLEATTANDIATTPTSKSVCKMGNGAVISFMDNGTYYDRKLFNSAIKTAEQNGIKVQTKNAVAGGNNASAIHLSKGGVKTLAISLPSRYIHSPSCVADLSDAKHMLDLTEKLLPMLCSDSV